MVYKKGKTSVSGRIFRTDAKRPYQPSSGGDLSGYSKKALVDWQKKLEKEKIKWKNEIDEQGPNMLRMAEYLSASDILSDIREELFYRFQKASERRQKREEKFEAFEKIHPSDDYDPYIDTAFAEEVHLIAEDLKISEEDFKKINDDILYDFNVTELPYLHYRDDISVRENIPISQIPNPPYLSRIKKESWEKTYNPIIEILEPYGLTSKQRKRLKVEFQLLLIPYYLEDQYNRLQEKRNRW